MSKTERWLVYKKKKKTLVISNFSLGWTREWSDGQEVPYAYSGSNWVGYDDTESIARKVRHLFFSEIFFVFFI